MRPLLTEGQLSDTTGVPVSTLQRWRLEGGGPRWIKAGRAVRYRPEDVEHWLEDNARGGQREKTPARD